MNANTSNRLSRWIVMTAVTGGLGFAQSTPSHAAVAPYTADADTLALYHFDEAPGVADPGTPIANFGTGGAALDLSNTGGPDGRDDDANNGGGYGATTISGFGSAFNILASGNGMYSNVSHAGTGGVRSAGAVTQASLQGASGAFTYEALINISTLSDDQVILSHDGGMDGSAPNRGFMFRIIGGQLGLYSPAGSIAVDLPGAGDIHAFDANQWFHVAVAYTGEAGTAGNTTFYWTRLDSGVTQANVLGTATLAADYGSSADTNWLGVGTGTRGEFRNQLKGLIDELRISGIAREADDFLFVVPEPASIALLAMGGLMVLGRRRV